ncbi:MAG: serine/threonine protein kinase [Phycisphaerales bacterium]|nr:serine/threonine protein kinase [Phycisphaerales bacterium]
MTDLNPSQFARLHLAYLALAETPVGERAARARELLGDDPILMGEFESLPHSDHIPTAFLEPPQPAARHSPWKEDKQIGPMVGRFRLLSLLGEGGFGMVYEAEQSEPVRRRVALKVIKPGMDSRAVLSRFEAERQALALMDHPCIARVYDGGSTGPESGHPGLPYFVMELVRGDSITTFCDRERLTIERRIELMIQVCEAVQHAHLKGIIHRDIKPSNVLVWYQDGKPTPKVIDFGVAKAVGHGLTEHTLFTHRGQLVGTPAYMSPEQAEMSGVDVDSRTDVYSLGVLLYEVLTSRPPFDPETLRSAGYAEMVRIIREVEPPRPSTRLNTLLRTREGDDTAVAIAKARRAELSALTRRLRTDLDWVVMKCLQKERDHRYTTAREMADELRRILTHEPVRAGPPRVGYRLRKFARRHRGPLAWSAALLVAMSGGVVVGLAAWRTAQHNAALLEQLREQLSRSANETGVLSGGYRVDPVGLIEMEVDPWVRAAIEAFEQPSDAAGPQADGRYAQLVERARSLLTLPDPGQVDLRLRMGKILLVQGDALASLRRGGPRDLETAEQCYRRVLALLPGENESAGQALDAVMMRSRAWAGLGDVRRGSDVLGSQAAYLESLELLDQDIVVPPQRRGDFDRARSRARRDVAVALARLCQVDDADRMALSVVQERERALKAVPANTPEHLRAQRDLCVALTTLAEVRGLANRPTQAVQSAREALELRQQALDQVTAWAVSAHPDDPTRDAVDWARRNLPTFERDVPVTRLILADNLVALSDIVGAVAECDLADAELSALQEASPGDQRLRATLLECILVRSELASLAGDGAGTLAGVERGRQVAGGLRPGFERDVLIACRLNLLKGQGLRLVGQPQTAISPLQESVRHARQMWEHDPARIEYARLLGRGLVELGQAFLDAGDLAGAQTAATQAGTLYSGLGATGQSCGLTQADLEAAPRLLVQIDMRRP